MAAVHEDAFTTFSDQSKFVEDVLASLGHGVLSLCLQDGQGSFPLVSGIRRFVEVRCPPQAQGKTLVALTAEVDPTQPSPPTSSQHLAFEFTAAESVRGIHREHQREPMRPSSGHFVKITPKEGQEKIVLSFFSILGLPIRLSWTVTPLIPRQHGCRTRGSFLDTANLIVLEDTAGYTKFKKKVISDLIATRKVQLAKQTLRKFRKHFLCRLVHPPRWKFKFFSERRWVEIVPCLSSQRVLLLVVWNQEQFLRPDERKKFYVGLAHIQQIRKESHSSGQVCTSLNACFWSQKRITEKFTKFHKNSKALSYKDSLPSCSRLASPEVDGAQSRWSRILSSAKATSGAFSVSTGRESVPAPFVDTFPIDFGPQAEPQSVTSATLKSANFAFRARSFAHELRTETKDQRRHEWRAKTAVSFAEMAGSGESGGLLKKRAGAVAPPARPMNEEAVAKTYGNEFDAVKTLRECHAWTRVFWNDPDSASDFLRRESIAQRAINHKKAPATARSGSRTFR